MLVVVAAVLRLVHLGDRPMHHDESLDAWWSWRLLEGEPYSYDPVYHGPLRFYVTAGFFRVLGESEATARLLAALCGTALVALAGATRRWLGNVGSITAAALLCLSPSMLYFSRFGREDLPFAVVELTLVLLIVAWLRRPAPWHPPVLGAVLAAGFALKETSFIVVAVLGSYVGALMALELLDRRRGRTTPPAARAWSAFLAPGPAALVQGLVAFAFTFSLLFSVGFTDPGGIGAGAFDGIRYWLSQQPVNRGSQPWPYYLAILAGYEWPILLLAGVGLGAAARRPDPVRGLLVWHAVANLAIYSWASERFPWLVVHPLVAIILLAGLGAEALHRRLPRLLAGTPAALTPRRVAVVGGAATLTALVVLAVPPVYRDPSSPHHLLVAVQTSPDLSAVRDRVEARYLLAPADDPPRVVIDVRDSATWPWAWYLRDRPVLYADLGRDPDAVVGADVVLTRFDQSGLLPAPGPGWTEVRPYDHRVWWLPPWGDAGAGDWLGWITRREAFGGFGALQTVELVAGNGW